MVLHPRRSIWGVSVTESFDSFLARLSSEAASRDAIGRGVAIAPYWGPQGDGPGAASDKHILTMCSKHPSRFEIRHGVNRRASYVKQPGSLSLVPAGECPLMRAETAFALVACAFDAAWVSALDAELERRPEGALRVQVNVEDPAAQQLLTLLMAEAHEGGTTDRLYTESLAQALAVRMLFLGSRTQAPSNKAGTYGLPRPVLRR